MWGISWLAEDLVASQERLCSLELVFFFSIVYRYAKRNPKRMPLPRLSFSHRRVCMWKKWRRERFWGIFKISTTLFEVLFAYLQLCVGLRPWGVDVCVCVCVYTVDKSTVRHTLHPLLSSYSFTMFEIVGRKIIIQNCEVLCLRLWKLCFW
jgi:hypothetical protein